jgi:hypothetical protein
MGRRGRVWQEGRGKNAPAVRGAPWFFVVDISPPGGVRRQVKRRGFASKEAAEAALADLVGEVRSGTHVRPSKLTVGGYLRQWLEALPASGRRPSTIWSYRQAIEANVLRYPSPTCRCRP